MWVGAFCIGLWFAGWVLWFVVCGFGCFAVVSRLDLFGFC